MKNRISKRARMFKRVLRYINDDDFKDFGDHLVFGMGSKSNREQPAPLTGADWEFLTKVSDATRRYAGDVLSQERVSLRGTSNIEDLFRQLDDLAARERSEFATAAVHAYREMLMGARTQRTFRVLSKGQIDAVDQHYAEEILDKLEKVVSRASRLQRLELKEIPKRSLQIYFEEAHRCYLYGFKVASVVMCRAILESALKETIDPKGELRPKERGESHILKMINKAKIYGRLSDPLPQWAAAVKEAGDSAVHDVEAFERHYPAGRLEDILCKARKVVESLYGPPVSRVQSDPCSG